MTNTYYMGPYEIDKIVFEEAVTLWDKRAYIQGDFLIVQELPGHSLTFYNLRTVDRMEGVRKINEE